MCFHPLISLLLLVFLIQVFVSNGFLPTKKISWRDRFTVSRSSKEEEIARLEEKLRRLKQDEDASTSKEQSTMVELKEPTSDEMIMLPDTILSERELMSLTAEGDSQESGNGPGLVSIAVAIVSVVGVILFSQIPVGQEDLARYSASGSATVKTIDLGDLNPDSNRD